MKNKGKILGGAGIGFINGLFGAGGGMLAVPLLKKLGYDEKAAHRSSLAVIFPLTVFSLVLYYIDGRITLSDGLPYLLPGVLGALLGVYFLSKIPDKALRKSFSILLIWSGARMIFK